MRRSRKNTVPNPEQAGILSKVHKRNGSKVIITGGMGGGAIAIFPSQQIGS